MKKRIIALLLVLLLLLPAGIASAATWYRVNTSSLRVRYLPSESAQVLGSYRRDYALTVKSTKDGWSYVRFSDGKEGYVQSTYIKKGSSYSAWITNDGTALRKGPDGSFGSIATLAKGRKVTVLTHGSKYDYVSAGNLGSGYVVNSLLSKKKVSASGTGSQSTVVTGGGYYAWVLNAGYRKVNLRSYASTSAPIIAQYNTGTKVYVVSHGGTWDKVQVNGNTGYMMTKFLSTSEPAPTATPGSSGSSSSSSYTAYVVSSNKKAVNVRKGNSENYSVVFKAPYGAEVTVLKHNTKWDYIEYKGKKGYINNSFLQLTKPADAPDDDSGSSGSSGGSSFTPYTGTITSPDGKSVNFHKRMGTWSSNVDGVGRLKVGTEVTVLGITQGWAKCQYGKYVGWVMKKYVTP